MKTKKTYWKRVAAVLLVSIITIMGIFYSCEKENIQPNRQESFEKGDLDVNEPICGAIVRKDLLDKNNKKYGFVRFYNDSRYLYVNVIAEREHTLSNAYLYVGSREELPLNIRGDIKYKSFKNFILTEEPVHTQTFQYPLAGLPRTFIISFMTQIPDVHNDENTTQYTNSWANGKLIGDNVGGRIFYYKRAICKEDAPVEFDE